MAQDVVDVNRPIEYEFLKFYVCIKLKTSPFFLYYS